MAKPQVSTIIAGASNPEQLSANLKALDWKLTQEDLNEIDQILEGKSS